MFFFVLIIIIINLLFNYFISNLRRFTNLTIPRLQNMSAENIISRSTTSVWWCFSEESLYCPLKFTDLIELKFCLMVRISKTQHEVNLLDKQASWDVEQIYVCHLRGNEKAKWLSISVFWLETYVAVKVGTKFK